MQMIYSTVVFWAFLLHLQANMYLYIVKEKICFIFTLTIFNNYTQKTCINLNPFTRTKTFNDKMSLSYGAFISFLTTQGI